MWIVKQIVEKSEYSSGEIRKGRIRNKVTRFAKYADEDNMIMAIITTTTVTTAVVGKIFILRLSWSA